MSEDDTFRRLMREPFHEVHKRVLNASFGRLHGWTPQHPERWPSDVEIIVSAGWTTEEYFKEYKAQNPWMGKINYTPTFGSK